MCRGIPQVWRPPLLAAVLLGSVVLVGAACGGSDAGPVTQPPATAPGAAADASPEPPAVAEPAPTETTQPRPVPEASPPPAADLDPPSRGGGRVGGDLDDVLPTVSTMAQSAPPPPQVSDGAADAPEGVEGVVVVPVTSNEHVRYDVEYPTAPPAGGPHLGIWLNCGFYTVPVLDELAVHSLEHGAVWVTYRSDVAAGALGELQVLAAQSSHILASPYEDQASPLVLSAWGRQLHLDSITDPRFDQFMDVYLFDGPTAPEPGVACSGAVGVPPEHPEAVPQQG